MATLERELGHQRGHRPGAGPPGVRRARRRACLAGRRRGPSAVGVRRDGRRAVALIRDHVARGSRIVIHGDYDVDGVCSTAILVRALRALGAAPAWYLPSRSEDGYGLRPHTVQRLAAQGTQLLITADCAITAVDEVAQARAAGMDVLVTDHHSPRADGVLPDAPIIHPAICGYPFPDLCGAGVALKLARGAGRADRRRGPRPRGAGHGRRRGARCTARTAAWCARACGRCARRASPGLRALMAVAKCDPLRLDAGDVAFRLAPRINAAGRLRRADAGLELALTEDPQRAQAIAEELDRVNVERRAVEQRMLWEAEAQAREPGRRARDRRRQPRAGIPAWPASSPPSSSSATTARRW